MEKQASREKLLQAISDFRAWQLRAFPHKKTYEISGEWETYYGGWSHIHTAFCHVLQELEPGQADSHLLDEMVYIIARDNECELLMEELIEYPGWFGVLCKHSLGADEEEAKWQFAVHLPECECDRKTKDLILAFAEEPEEYVCRRALLAMPQVYPDKVLFYAEWFWDREWYSSELQEYQRMAVLTALHAISSPRLGEYLAKAKADRRKFLRQCAERIENG